MIQSEEGRREHDIGRIEWAFSSALLNTVSGLISRSAAAAVVSSFLFCRAHVRPPSDFDHALGNNENEGRRGRGLQFSL